MKRRMLAMLAATVALPLAGTPAMAQDDWRDHDRYAEDWEPRYERYEDRYRYMRDRYMSERDPYRRGTSRDRWADRPTYDREFDRRMAPPDYRGEDFGDYGDERRYREERRREYYTDSEGGRGGYGDRYDGRVRYSQESRYEQMDGPGSRAMQRASRDIRTFDSDGDGRVTQKEVDDYRANRLKEFDENQDGQLSLAEYERLWLDGMRERMVDRFQSHDNDGDGQVTSEEFSAATSDMVRMRDRDGDGVFSFGDLGPRGGQEWRRRHGGERSEDYADRPEVEAPLGGSPNDPEAPVSAEEDAGSENASQNRSDDNDDEKNESN